MLNLDGRLSPVTLARPAVPVLRRYHRPLAAAAAALVLLWLLFMHQHSSTSNDTVSVFWSFAANSHAHPYSTKAEHFWKELADVLYEYRPASDPVSLSGDPGWLLYNPREAPSARPDLARLPAHDVARLKQLHADATAALRALAPRLPFNKGTRGIVTTANNDALTILATSLRMLRKTGSTLPVEIMVDEWESEPCESIFPALGARCVFVEQLVSGDGVPDAFRFGHFSWKAAIVAFSSFEQVLFLDSDLFPVAKPEQLFKQKPFKGKGYVLWPDYWSSTASRLLYEIIDLPTPEMGERASTESGAIMIDKDTHAAAVLQALYYNVYGEKYYYPLFSQGATGFGDKETWLAAAQVHRLPLYQVAEAPVRLGYYCNEHERPIASGQHHPGDDYAITVAGARHPTRSGLIAPPKPRIMFVHGNLPKYDAPGLLDWDMPELDWQDMLRCDRNTGKAHRLWGAKEMTLVRFGWDVEKTLWDSMRWVACEHEQGFSIWTNGSWHSKPRRDVCTNVTSFYAELMPNETYDASLDAVESMSASTGWSYWLS